MVAQPVTEDTAAPQVDTAALVESEPPVEQPETLLADAPETEPVEVAPETEQPAPETVRDWREQLAEIDENELLEHDRFKSLLARRTEAERRKIEQDQKLRAGQDQNVRFVVGTLLQKLDAGEITPEQFSTTAAQVYDAARYAASVELGQKLPEVLMRDFNIPVEFRERAVTAKLEDNGNLDRYTRTLIEGAVEAEKGKLRLKDVSEGSTLHKDIQAEVAKKVEAELKAKAVAEQPRRETPPPTPRGTNGAGSALSFEDAVRRYNAGEITHEEYKAARKANGLS